VNLKIFIEITCVSFDVDDLTKMNIFITKNIWKVEIGCGNYLEIEAMLVTQPSTPALIHLRQPLRRLASGPWWFRKRSITKKCLSNVYFIFVALLWATEISCNSKTSVKSFGYVNVSITLFPKVSMSSSLDFNWCTAHRSGLDVQVANRISRLCPVTGEDLQPVDGEGVCQK
jgi:hypothetical protein